MNGNPVIFAFAAVLAAAFAIFLLLFFLHFRLWLQALLAGVSVSLFDLIGMRLRRTPPALIVQAMSVLKQRGVMAAVEDVEGTYLASLALGECVATPTELADLVEEAKRGSPGAPG